MSETAGTEDHTTDWPALDAWLADAGLRRTRATLQAVQLFLNDPSWAATHADVERALADHAVHINRVTLYRLLDRLVAAGLLVRQADDDARTWRFRLADAWLPPLETPPPTGAGAPAQPAATDEGVLWVPRFECDGCHRQFRLTQASQSTQAVARQLMDALAAMGHQGQRVDLSIHGMCAVCVDTPASGAGVHP